MSNLKITERGWPGHYICANYCHYRRNTLVSYGNKKVVVSTVGNYFPSHSDKAKMIGYNRYYETMAFMAKKVGVYWEADVTKQISFDSDWSIDKTTEETDFEAEKMHEAVVKEIANKLVSGGKK